MSGSMSDAPGSGGQWHRHLWPWLATGVAVGLGIWQLRSQGRQWWCACGEPFLWCGDVFGRHNSQHLLDPYSLTHVLHGVVLCGLASWLCPGIRPSWQMFLAVAAETIWEVIENTPYTIERYRALAIAAGYQGDTIANSLGDIGCCAAGFFAARRLGFWGSVGLFVGVESVLMIWIGDNLVLDVVRLICGG